MIEISRNFIQFNKIEDTLKTLWSNNSALVLINKSITIYTLPCNVQCLNKNVNSSLSMIECPVNSTTQFPPSKQKCKYLKPKTNLNSSYWLHNDHIVKNMVFITDFSVSPEAFLLNNEQIIAVLNSIGRIELLIRGRHSWNSLINISDYIDVKYKRELNLLDVKTKRPSKKAIDVFTCTAMCWSPKVNDDKSCNFITAQKDGTFIIWSLVVKNEIISNIKYTLKSGTENVKSITWISESSKSFILIYTNVLGQIYAMKCTLIQNEEIMSSDPVLIWKHKDAIKTTVEYVQTDEGNILLVFNKHTLLVVQVIDKNGHVLLENITNVNNCKIVTVTRSYNTFYVATINLKVYSLKISVNSEISIILEPLALKITGLTSTHELCGVVVSRNNMFCVALVLDTKVLVRKGHHEIETVWLSCIPDLESVLSFLVNNSSNSLTFVWDTIELLRCRVIKQKALPSYDYTKLYSSANDNIYLLKLYLILVKMYSALKGAVMIYDKHKLPETNIENVKNKISILHCKSLLSKLCKKYAENNGILEKFEIETFFSVKKYLSKYFTKSNLVWIPSSIEMTVSQDIKDEFEYVCQACDKFIVVDMCEDNHKNMICSITRIPIESEEYLYCRSCGELACIELQELNPTCIYCDLYLTKVFL